MASQALAQNFTLWLEPGDISPSGSFTVSVYGDADVGTHYRGGAFGLQVTSLDGTGSVTDIAWDLTLGFPFFNFPDLGYAGGGTYTGLAFGYLVGPCDIFPCPPFELGERIGYFTIEVDPSVMSTYQIDLVAGPDVDPTFPFSLETVDIPSGQAWNDSSGTLTLSGATVSIVPAPPVVWALTLSSLPLLKRTRRKAI